MERLCMGCMEKYDDSLDVCPYCGYAFDTPPEQSYHLKPGTILHGQYVVGRVLGFGGFGITYIGWDYVMERKLAIKEYLPGEFATRVPEENQVTIYSGDREEQFKAGLVKTIDEAKRLAKFEHVPGIVQIYDCFEENGTSYIVMEYLRGMSLKDYLLKKGRLPLDEALNITLQVATAMEEVHKEGLLHRDIAPDNIYVLNPDEEDHLEVKILDFGAARYATTKHSKSLSVIIKPGYAPEEQYRSRGDQGTWTDVYALAAVLYKMITGVTPADAMERSVNDTLKKPSRLGVKISRPMETALMNALHVKIQDRTQTMEEFAAELMAAEVKERHITPNKKNPVAIPKWLFAGAGAISMVIVTIGVLLLTGVISLHISADSSTLEDNMTYVPNVVNRTEDEGLILLQDAGLGMNADHRDFSEEIPLNMISYQAQRANSTLPKGDYVQVWVSMGPETGMIPSVLGLQKEEAVSILAEAGFDNVSLKKSDEPGGYNTILRIQRSGESLGTGLALDVGSSVALSTEITLVWCGTQAESSEGMTYVPDVDITSLTKEEVEQTFTEAGLNVTWIGEYDENAPLDTVLGMEDYESGQEVTAGTFIKVLYSLGQEKISMVNISRDYTEDGARKILEGLGLNLGDVSYEYSSSVSEGRVISQSIEVGAEVHAGDTIDIVVSRGPVPTEAATRQTQAQTQAQTRAQTEPETAAPQTEPETATPQTELETQPQTQAQTEAQTAAPQTQPETVSPEGDDLAEFLGIADPNAY